MKAFKLFLLLGALSGVVACRHDTGSQWEEPGGLSGPCARGIENACGAGLSDEGVRTKGGTVSLRIWALIGQGNFVEAEALIIESTAAGTLAQTQATRMLERIALLNTRLGQIPASLQRVRDFPSQLREHTLFEIKQLLERRDFTLATQAQLKQAEKLIEQQARLMEKVK